MPLTAALPLKVTPFVLGIFKLATASEVNRLAGTLCAAPPLKVIVPVDAPMVPLVLATVPFIVNVLLPILKAPSVKVAAVPTVRSVPNVTEPVVVRFTVRLANVRLPVSKLIVPKAPVPLMIRLDVLLPLIKPLPLTVEASAAVPNVNVRPFKSSISVALVKVSALPVLGAPVSKSTNNLTDPDAFVTTI